MLKLAGPWDRTADEIACLRLWAGGPAPELLEADESRSAILLERILPGTPASDAGAERVASLLREIQLRDTIGLRPLLDTVRRRLDRARAGAACHRPSGSPGPEPPSSDWQRRGRHR